MSEKWCPHFGTGRLDRSDERINDGCEQGSIGGTDFGKTANHNHRFIWCTVLVYRDCAFRHSKRPFRNLINALIVSIVFDEGYVTLIQ
jgi:hypothetical protein